MHGSAVALSGSALRQSLQMAVPHSESTSCYDPERDRSAVKKTLRLWPSRSKRLLKLRTSGKRLRWTGAQTWKDTCPGEQAQKCAFAVRGRTRCAKPLSHRSGGVGLPFPGETMLIVAPMMLASMKRGQGMRSAPARISAIERKTGKNCARRVILPPSAGTDTDRA